MKNSLYWIIGAAILIVVIYAVWSRYTRSATGSSAQQESSPTAQRTFPDILRETPGAPPIQP